MCHRDKLHFPHSLAFCLPGGPCPREVLLWVTGMGRSSRYDHTGSNTSPGLGGTSSADPKPTRQHFQWCSSSFSNCSFLRIPLLCSSSIPPIPLVLLALLIYVKPIPSKSRLVSVFLVRLLPKHYLLTYSLLEYLPCVFQRFSAQCRRL